MDGHKLQWGTSTTVVWDKLIWHSEFKRSQWKYNKLLRGWSILCLLQVDLIRLPQIIVIIGDDPFYLPATLFTNYYYQFSIDMAIFQGSLFIVFCRAVKYPSIPTTKLGNIWHLADISSPSARKLVAEELNWRANNFEN